MKKIKDMLIFIFGEKKKTRYIRMMLTVLLIVFCFTMIQNVGCGYDKNGFYFKWQPAAEIKIEK